ncbi:MAG: hypothetical protein HC831_05830 [Chloroflexia bacterium]|nr:hypothetical protein [Chloroflexia bacterium]
MRSRKTWISSAEAMSPASTGRTAAVVIFARYDGCNKCNNKQNMGFHEVRF